MNEVLPKPEQLGGTRDCELAALLVTLGFEPADKQMSIATGDGIPGGKLGYWRFLPQHPQKKFSLTAVLARGVKITPAVAPGLPVYREQAVIAAAFHNYRLLVESLTHGTRLCLEPRGEFFVYRRVEARAAAEHPAAADLQKLTAHGTRNTELAAALSTLGFAPAFTGTAVAHELTGAVWHFPAQSADGHYQLQERMARWQDAAWCAREDNNDPIACMADAFWNLRHLRRSLHDARVLVQVKNGSRSVLVRKDAAAATWERAERFLLRK